MPHGNERCEYCNMREIDGHRWDCPASDEDAEDWAEDDVANEDDWWNDDDEEEVPDAR